VPLTGIEIDLDDASIASTAVEQRDVDSQPVRTNT